MMKGARLHAGECEVWLSASRFKDACAEFLKATFVELGHLRPGTWDIHRVVGRDRLEIAKSEQYAHLIALDKATRADRELAAAIGRDYTITPDIVVIREAEDDAAINSPKCLINPFVATNAIRTNAERLEEVLQALVLTGTARILRGDESVRS